MAIELKQMPKTLSRPLSLNLRHTLESKPQLNLKEVLHQIRSFESIDEESSHKRQYSLTSTRIPETNPSSSLRHIGSA